MYVYKSARESSLAKAVLSSWGNSGRGWAVVAVEIRTGSVMTCSGCTLLTVVPWLRQLISGQIGATSKCLRV